MHIVKTTSIVSTAFRAGGNSVSSRNRVVTSRTQKQLRAVTENLDLGSHRKKEM